MKNRIKALLFAAIFSLFILSNSDQVAGSMATHEQNGADQNITQVTELSEFLPIIQMRSRPPDEFQMVERFAPVLAFDKNYNGLPMSADVYFNSMMTFPGWSPAIINDKIGWIAEPDPSIFGYGPFTDPAGWWAPEYYASIQTADVDGDKQAEQVGRSACGVETWHFKNYIYPYWYKIADCSPDWSDAGGWGEEKHNRTIQAADVDGDGQEELLGRAWCGMETWHFKPSSNTWVRLNTCNPAWGDLEGWGEASKYFTIQTADVNGDGQAELLGRSACGMETWHFNTSSNTWESLSSCSPAWSDAGGWGEEKHSRTIQAADVNGDGQEELLGRAWCGMETWHFNTSNNTWESLDSCNPAWGDLEGWDDASHYLTIQTADVDGIGQAELLGRSACGMETWHFNTSSNTWESLSSCNPDFSDPVWAYPYYYRTIQADDIGGEGEEELMVRTMCGMYTYQFNNSTHVWDLKTACSPGFTDPEWAYEQFYSTIQTADVDGNSKSELLARSQFGMYSFKYSNTYTWQLQSPMARISLCGRDFCQEGMSAGDFSILTSGQTPTYYRVGYDDFGRARIDYWWFYGFQPHCNDGLPPEIPYEGPDGAHHGDWEHILVTTNPERTMIDYVTFFFHGEWYTRKRNGDTYYFDREGERPIVYVSRLSHGSYHSKEFSGWGVGTPYDCCTYADYRDPIYPNTYWHTDLNLVNLDGNSESWMLADRVGSTYTYKGETYTIVQWQWGPNHEYCNWWLVECQDWNVETGVGTHPTTVPINWNMVSCDKTGCGTAYCDAFIDVNYPYPAFFNQGWIWDLLTGGLPNNTEDSPSCNVP